MIFLAKIQKMYYSFAACSQGTGRSQTALFFSIIIFFLLTGAPAFSASNRDEDVAREFRAKAIQCQENGDPQQAYLYFTKAILFSPKDPELYNAAGMMAEASGRPEEALSYYRGALLLNPRYLPVYYNIGMYYLDHAEYDLAEHYLKERVAFARPDDPWKEKSLAALEELYGKSPRHRAKRHGQMQAELDELAKQEALKQSVKEVENRQMSFFLAYRRGLGAFQEGEYWLAAQFFEEALNIDPTRQDVRHALERSRSLSRKYNVNLELDMALRENKGTIVANNLDRAEVQ